MEGFEHALDDFVKQWDGNEASLTDKVLDDFMKKSGVKDNGTMQRNANRIVLRAMIITRKQEINSV